MAWPQATPKPHPSITHLLKTSFSFFLSLHLLQLVPVYMEEAKKLEEKVQDFDKLKDMEERVGDLERELHWAFVYEIESVCFIRNPQRTLS